MMLPLVTLGSRELVDHEQRQGHLEYERRNHLRVPGETKAAEYKPQPYAAVDRQQDV